MDVNPVAVTVSKWFPRIVGRYRKLAEDWPFEITTEVIVLESDTSRKIPANELFRFTVTLLVAFAAVLLVLHNSTVINPEVLLTTTDCGELAYASLTGAGVAATMRF